MPGRSAWREIARPAQLAPPEYERWNIWTDRAWGASRAIREEMMEFVRGKVQGPHGRPPLIIDIIPGGSPWDMKLTDREGFSAISDISFTVNTTTREIEFANGSRILSVNVRQVQDQRLRGLQPQLVVVDGFDLMTVQHQDEVEEAIGRARAPSAILSFHRPPAMPPKWFTGKGRHLTIGMGEPGAVRLIDVPARVVEAP